MVSTVDHCGHRHTPLGNILVVPDLDEVVASTGHKSSLLARSRVGADQAACKGRRSPANRVDAHTVGVERLVGPRIVPELKDADMTIGRSAGKEASALVRGPRYHVHRRGVKGEIEDLGPRAAASRRGRVLQLFPPDQDLAIVRGGGQNCAKLGVGLAMKQSQRSVNLRRTSI
jgi:hypothetical protein